nr:hypothetical protein [Tanacetum cinerariifolium]
SKASRLESLKQKKQSVTREGSSATHTKYSDNSETGSDAIIYSSCSNTSEESANETDDADESGTDLTYDTPFGDDDVAGYGVFMYKKTTQTPNSTYLNSKFKFEIEIPTTMIDDAFKKTSKYKYYKAKKEESEKAKAIKEPKEQNVSSVRSGRGKGYMHSGENEANVPKMFKKNVVPRKTRYVCRVGAKTQWSTVDDPAVQSLLDLRKGSKASRLESLKQKKQSVTREGSIGISISNLNLLSTMFDNLVIVIIEYLVKISKKARILELKLRHLKITVLTTYMSYPSRKIRRIFACTSQETTKIYSLICRIQETSICRI